KIGNIGESGVFIETEDELLGVGSILEMDLALEGVAGSIHAFGVVRWRSTPPMPAGVGVQFVEVEQSGLAKLRRFMESQ
ncbi:MAG: PilZ domain-containing protein, partial [Planctomycetes bacterium]|nr:PilZ domain-containing protein [Planctomycetota bacterium]